MVNPEVFKKRIQENLLQNCSIEFLGKNFDKIVNNILSKLEDRIIDWILNIKNDRVIHIKSKLDIKYKNWSTKDLLVFRFQFNISNTEYRILLVKIKNENYIEFHLGEHSYYDKIRDKLGLKN